jgi:hypothetical protein
VSSAALSGTAEVVLIAATNPMAKTFAAMPFPLSECMFFPPFDISDESAIDDRAPPPRGRKIIPLQWLACTISANPRFNSSSETGAPVNPH